MNSLERYNKRKRILAGAKNTIITKSNVSQNIANEFLNSEVDTALINRVAKISEEHYKFDYDFSVSDEEAREFLERFKKEFNQGKFERLIGDCKKEVINSIVTPFGIGHIVAAYDKEGGNVTTIHNANKNIYANDSDKYERNDYDRSKNSNGQSFTGTNGAGREYVESRLLKKSYIEDEYTGRIEVASRTSPDHVISLSQYHKDGGFMQSTQQKADFATDPNNLAITSRSINQSMSDYSKDEWLQKQREDGTTNEAYFAIDRDRVAQKQNIANKTKQKHTPSNMDKTKYYAKNIANTGLTEGAKMGLQQAIGLVMTEFFTAFFDEIMDIYKNGFYSGFEDEKFFSILKDRLARIAERIKSKWKDVATAFKDGFISGFISNLATTVINMLITTGKRVVRIIRECFYALLKAVKPLLFPPENMSFEEAMHEAKKIIASGLIISLGVILEEYVSKLAVGLPFADILTAILVGAITGIAVTMTVYYIDHNKDDKEMMRLLIAKADEAAKRTEELQKQLLR
jgi:hypothetical protein